MQYQHQANPLLSMTNNTLIVISRNDKKAANILKPTQTSINFNKETFYIIQSSGPLKNLKNQTHPLVRPSSVKL